MDTINKLASKATNVIAGKHNTTAAGESVPRSMEQDDSVGGSSKPNYDGNHQIYTKHQRTNLTESQEQPIL